MASNIKEYRPSSASINPDDRAQQAWETAGRRVGPLLNQAASDQRERGQTIARGIRNRIWPYDIIALYERQAAEAEKAGADDGTRFGSRGGGGSLALQGGGGGSIGAASRAGRGAGAFAGMARSAAGGRGRADPDPYGLGGRSDADYDNQGNEIVGQNLHGYAPVRTPKGGWNAEAFKGAQDWYDATYARDQAIKSDVVEYARSYPDQTFFSSKDYVADTSAPGWGAQAWGAASGYVSETVGAMGSMVRQGAGLLANDLVNTDYNGP